MPNFEENHSSLHSYHQHLDETCGNLNLEVEELNDLISKLQSKFENIEDKVQLKIREELAIGVLRDVLRIEGEISNLNSRFDSFESHVIDILDIKLCGKVKTDLERLHIEFQKLSLKVPSDISDSLKNIRSNLTILENKIPDNNIKNFQELKSNVSILNERVPQDFNKKLLDEVSKTAISHKVFWVGTIGALATGVGIIIATFNAVTFSINQRISDTNSSITKYNKEVREDFSEIQSELEEIKKFKTSASKELDSDTHIELDSDNKNVAKNK